MRKETLRDIRELCKARYEALITSPNVMMDFNAVDGHYVATRFNGFKPECQNIVTKGGGDYVMSVCSLTLRDSLRINKWMGLSNHLDTLAGTFFFIPKGTVVPCHKDEEAHEGFKRGQRLLTFNASAPLTLLYTNSTGKDKEMAFAATDHFITILNPTATFHGVIVDPNEDLYLVQYPLIEPS